MKVNIITIHDPDVNYGSTLQSCGTYNFIKNLGYDVEIINYKPHYGSAINRVKHYIINHLFIIPYRIRRKKIDIYFIEHAKLSKEYHTYDDLKNNPPKGDVYITGSDVIWNRDINPEGGDKAFYLGFVKKGYKISYAPSMGELQSEANLRFLYENIKDFDYISVREEPSRAQLLDYGLKQVECVLDPVFLMDKEYYEKQLKKNTNGEYTLVYLMSETSDKRNKVKELASLYGDKVVSFGGFKKKCDCDTFIRDAGVEDFLTLIYNAKHIITDSFHCICFSLIFNKQFVYLPSIDSSMRIENILEKVHLSDRISRKGDNNLLILANRVINYEESNILLTNNIEISKRFLTTALSEIEKKEGI